MNYYKKINLHCIDVLKNYVINYINSSSHELTITQPTSNIVTLPNELLNVVNSELASYGISEIDYCRVYLWPRNSIQFPHIDGADTVLHCAINIPLHGGENSVFRWFEGRFELQSVNLVNTNQVAFSIKWITPKEVACSVEIKDGCYLVRIDQPHQAIASSSSDRWVFTMRFKDNPTFEDLYDRLPVSSI